MFHGQPIEKVLSDLSADPVSGLTAQQVAEKQARFGPNQLRQARRKSLLSRFLSQLKDPMILILLSAAAVSFWVAFAERNPRAFFEPALILLIVLLNAVMGVAQEQKAEKALDALKRMSAPHARVIREGQESIIDASQLVPGDLIRLEAGDFVPADARLLRSSSLKSEESALTGESVPAEKNADVSVAETAPLGDRTNMVFSGCSITCGTAAAVVTAIGMDTQMGKIAHLLEGEKETQTPLQKKLSRLGRSLGILALAACAVVLAVGFLSGLPLLEIFMTAVSLAVSAIPEGLPAIVTIVLSIGVQRMVKKNAIIRRLPAVETLGSASVICSDKTGTLTQNRMTLVQAYADGMGEAVSLSDEAPPPPVETLLRYGALCCDGTVVFHGDKEQHIGDPTETAIVLAAYKMGMPKETLERSYLRLAEIPFDSDRKQMSTVHEMDGRLIAIVKGAFDVMAPHCVQGDLETARRMVDEMSQQALRVLAIAYRELDALPDPLVPETLERELCFLGLVGMIDPPRSEAKEAVALCRKAGIRPVMITGDHVSTASAIARELGILQPGEEAITGMDLDAMEDAQLEQQVTHISVYARVSPENKIRIVKAWQKKGQVVAMTGDGVNDAPALKAADIGCAMGITGTDVAKGAADMTLTDDNFATIVDAVREGRGIYANIKKVVGYLLGTNIGEIVAVFFAMLLWQTSPLSSIHLLWINLVTDSLPAVALGMEPVEKGIMDRPPRPREEGLFAHGFGIRIALQGCMFGLLCLIAFSLGTRITGQTAGGQTMAFMVLAFSQILQSFQMRSEESLFKIGPFSNHPLNRATAVSAGLMLLVILTPLSAPFGLLSLPARGYVLSACLSLVPLPVMEGAKALGRLRQRSGK